jgi:uncharacterized RDD family membrane protein YckC
MSNFPPPPPASAPGYGYGAAPTQELATWPVRVGSYLIDAIVMSVPYGILLAVGQGVGGGVGVLLTLLGLASLIGMWVWNIGIKQGSTGQTIGKGVVGTRLVGEETGQPIGTGMALVRSIAHVLDALPCYIGYLWPLWDEKRQTFADKILKTLVVKG